MTPASAVLRLLLLIGVLVAAIAIVVIHGVRGIVLMVIVAIAVTGPRTQVWRVVEGWLVRLTGSRRRAAALVLGVVIAVLAAVNIYEFVH